MNVFKSVERYLPVDQLTSWALTGAACGLLAEIAFLPEAVRALLLLAFVLLGPGSVVLDRMGALPLVAVRALVPLTGLSVVLLAVSGGLLLGFWSSRVTLVVLVVLTAAGALINRHLAADPTLLDPSPVEPSAGATTRKQASAGAKDRAASL